MRRTKSYTSTSIWVNSMIEMDRISIKNKNHEIKEFSIRFLKEKSLELTHKINTNSKKLKIRIHSQAIKKLRFGVKEFILNFNGF